MLIFHYKDINNSLDLGKLCYFIPIQNNDSHAGFSADLIKFVS